MALGPKEIITINIVAPVPIIPKPQVADPADLAPVATKIFINAHIEQPGSTEEVAKAVEWLLSPLSRFATGQLVGYR